MTQSTLKEHTEIEGHTSLEIMGPGTQIRNLSTGHWVKRDSQTGQLFVSNGDEPFNNVPVTEILQAQPNPSIDLKTAQFAEKLVIDYLNKSSNI